MRRKRIERESPTNDVSMTPMIDVVFQLLIYFLVTFSTPDVLAHLDISRPAPDPSKTEQRTPPKMIRVNIYSEGGFQNGYSLNGRTVSRVELISILTRLASFSKNQTVLIRCTGDSEHAKLIGVLDICAQCNLSKISVMSLK